MSVYFYIITGFLKYFLIYFSPRKSIELIIFKYCFDNFNMMLKINKKIYYFYLKIIFKNILHHTVFWGDSAKIQIYH
jgi:hypothetical protein